MTKTVAFLIALAGTASCRQVVGITDDHPQACLDPEMIDDMEDATADICNSMGRRGDWYTEFAGSAPLALIPGGRATSRHAAHFEGTWGPGGYEWGALIGFDLNVQAARKHPYDASAFGGIKFWMKSYVPVFVEFPTPETLTPDCVDTATESNCVNHFSFQLQGTNGEWAEQQVPFSAVTQHDRTGMFSVFPLPGSATWRPDQLVAIQFLVMPDAPYDVWIDDVAFHDCALYACVPTCAHPDHPVPCPAKATQPAGCFPSGTDCTVIGSQP